VRDLFTDFQTRFLGGAPTPDRLRRAGIGPEWLARFEALGISETHEPPPRVCLERAKACLTACACVGTTGRVGEFLRALAYRFGWRPMADDVRANRRSDRPTAGSLDARTRVRVEEMTALDRELYEFARAIGREQLRQMVEAGPDWSRPEPGG
jgi:hypothetical protein